MNKQLNHYEYVHDNKRFPIYIILDKVEDFVNIGSIFRIADALGVKKIYICGVNTDIINKKVKRVARGTTDYIEYEFFESTEECINKLRNSKIKIIGLEITNESVSINSYNFKKEYEYAFVVGNEEKGVSEEVLNNVDDTVHIDMYGNNSSMNVAVSTGIAVNDCLNKIK